MERKARPIEILDIRYEGSPAENEYALTVKCSKGTYIRVLLEEIAEAMGQKGTMSALRRVAAGVYSEADAHTLEEIQAAKDAGPEALQALMLPVESVFASLPLQRVPHQPLSRCRRPLPRAERRRAVSGSCQCGERCAQGGKAVRGKELTTNANRFISVAPGAGT